MRGSTTWTPVARIADALDAAFQASFGSVRPSGKRWLLALDISGSMDGGPIAGIPNLLLRRFGVRLAAVPLVVAQLEAERGTEVGKLEHQHVKARASQTRDHGKNERRNEKSRDDHVTESPRARAGTQKAQSDDVREECPGERAEEAPNSHLVRPLHVVRHRLGSREAPPPDAPLEALDGHVEQYEFQPVSPGHRLVRSGGGVVC